jgi:geranylgeranyl pyrophosphate synthase
MDLTELYFLSLIRDDLERVEALLREHYPGQHEAIGLAIEHLVDGGGKRLRPALVLLSANVCGADLDRAIFAAAAVEMLHTATLVHDDLIDGSLMRRGTETLNSHWSPNATVLTGDYVFAYAAYLASRADNVRLMQRFSETLMVICNGEIQQMFDRRDRQPTHREYERRIYAKTASLIAMSTEAGAILAGVGQTTVETLRSFGEQLGLAFQIVDDVLDYVADEERLGKPVGSDLRQGLITLPLLFFLEEESGSSQALVRRALAGTPSQDLVSEAVQVVAESPAIERALEVARGHADQAKQTLGDFPDSPYKTAFLELVDFTVRRRF